MQAGARSRRSHAFGMQRFDHSKDYFGTLIKGVFAPNPITQLEIDSSAVAEPFERPLEAARKIKVTPVPNFVFPLGRPMPRYNLRMRLADRSDAHNLGRAREVLPGLGQFDAYLHALPQTAQRQKRNVKSVAAGCTELRGDVVSIAISKGAGKETIIDIDLDLQRTRRAAAPRRGDSVLRCFPDYDVRALRKPRRRRPSF